MRNLIKQLQDIEGITAHMEDELSDLLGEKVLLSPHTWANSFSLIKVGEDAADSSRYSLDNNEWIDKGVFTDEQLNIAKEFLC